MAELGAEVEGAEEGGLVLAARLSGVEALVGRVKGRVGLEDDVGLAGDEVAGGVRVREDGGRSSGAGGGVDEGRAVGFGGELPGGGFLLGGGGGDCPAGGLGASA